MNPAGNNRRKAGKRQSMNANTARINAGHAWTIAGLGAAPFRIRSFIDTNAAGTGVRHVGTSDGVKTETSSGGTCAYCGRAIIILVGFESADGRRFHVGTKCAEKANDVSDGGQGAVNAYNLKRLMKRRAKNAAALRYERNMARYEAERARFDGIPHPKASFAAVGGTMCAAIDWSKDHGGATYRVKVCRMIEGVLGRLPK